MRHFLLFTHHFKKKNNKTHKHKKKPQKKT